jgi:HEAT repeat protein
VVAFVFSTYAAFAAAPAAKTPSAKPGTAATAKKEPAALPPLEKASWIWAALDEDVCQLRTLVVLEDKPTAANVLITADNGYELYVNGTEVGLDIGAEGEVWQSVERYDIASRLTKGRNVIGIRGTDLGGVRGLVAAVRIEVKGQAPIEIVTDAKWRVSVKGKPADYSHPEFVEGQDWANATIVGPMGMAPWGKLSYSGSAGGRRSMGGRVPVELAKPDKDFQWPEAIAFVGSDCSVYVPLRGDAWGVCFRVSDWTRAYTEFDIPCPSKIGRKLYLVKPLGPDAKPRLLVDAGKGAIGSPSASFDGKSIYAAMALGDDSFFHIYRVPLDGGKPERLTSGPYHDIDPSELPDGRIVFTSTRIGSFEEYHNPPSRALYVMNTDGTRIEPITFTLIFDNEPKVMADGRIAFIRTDNFFDRGKVETQLHVIRPDGTDGYTELGANTGADYGGRLRGLGYGSPAPMPDGKLACISTQGNFIAPAGGADRQFRPLPGSLGDLAPLPDGRLLATVLERDARRMNSEKIAVIDPRDNKLTSVYESTEGSVHSPIYVGPRPRPTVIPEQVDRKQVGTPTATGFLNCQNVRLTRKTKADWEQVRAIRVLGALALTTRSSHSHIVHAGHETVELGTVPLAPDGSFSVEVPADMPIMLQAVDAEGRSELNEMSWIYVRPGERRSCIGCHHARGATPAPQSSMSLALSAKPAKLLGQGYAHRFRGNNSGVTGMMDLQFERFREMASMNLLSPTGRQEVDHQVQELRGVDPSLKISAAQRLSIFRDRAGAQALTECLRGEGRDVRLAAALALATCGTRETVPVLLDVLDDDDALVAQAVAMALENLTGHAEPFQPFDSPGQRKAQADAWRAWFKATSWDAIEQSLIQRLASADRPLRRRAIVALGHVGGNLGRAALGQVVATDKAVNPYPVFKGDNRTDSFTFPAASPYNPRTLQEATRAIGYLKDATAVPLLREALLGNIEPKTGNLYLAEAAAEALGRIATPEAEAVLIEAFGKSGNYWDHVGWYSDHPALYACHSSPVHGRIIEALDRMASTRAASIVPPMLRSIPTDPDRALFPENDDYEIMVGRVVRRSGLADELTETCLALLGEPQAKAAGVAGPRGPDAKAAAELKQAAGAAFGAWAGHPAPDNRAAQVLSLVCRDAKYEPRIRAVYEMYRAKPEDPIKRPLGNPSWIPQRHWVLFFLGRALGNVADKASVDTLLASLKPELNEARHGHPDPSEPNIHFLQLEYTPCWRVTAAWALGHIGDRRAVPTLLEVVGDLRNAVDVRHAAAEALLRLATPANLEALKKLANDTPDHSVRRVLLRACAAAAGEPVMTMLE